MKLEEVIILEREDLMECSKSNDIRLLSILDFSGIPTNCYRNKEKIVIFIDEDGEIKIINNYKSIKKTKQK